MMVFDFQKEPLSDGEEDENPITPLRYSVASLQDLEEEEDLFQAFLSASEESVLGSNQPLEFLLQVSSPRRGVPNPRTQWF